VTRPSSFTGRDDLAGWQKTNVTAFRVSGIAGTPTHPGTAHPRPARRAQDGRQDRRPAALPPL